MRDESFKGCFESFRLMVEVLGVLEEVVEQSSFQDLRVNGEGIDAEDEFNETLMSLLLQVPIRVVNGYLD